MAGGSPPTIDYTHLNLSDWDTCELCLCEFHPCCLDPRDRQALSWIVGVRVMARTRILRRWLYEDAVPAPGAHQMLSIAQAEMQEAHQMLEQRTHRIPRKPHCPRCRLRDGSHVPSIREQALNIR